MGKDEEGLIQIAYRQNMPVSDRIRNAPDLMHGLQFYVDAFNLLTPSRTAFEGGIGHIPYSEMSKFCDDLQLEADMREDVYYLVSKLDQFYVDWQDKNIKRKRDALSKSQATPTKPKRR